MTGDTIPGDSELGLTARAPREYRSGVISGISGRPTGVPDRDSRGAS